MKYFIYTIIGIVFVSVVAGFFIVGSPQKERMRRFDEKRIQDLQFLQSEILNYWLNKGNLPLTIEDLSDDIRGVVIPKDPESGSNYEYTRKTDEIFILCADFILSSFIRSESNLKPRFPVGISYEQQNWEHGVGRTCFERKIDKELYRPLKAK